ncbi:MAG: magnesium/cobalt transporter CorA [Gammaproteobacteria bacterium]
MIVAYFEKQSRIQSVPITEENSQILKDVIWIDMLSPTKSEELIVEKQLKIYIPTRNEAQTIESSTRLRLYVEHNTLFMTAMMIAKSDSTNPKNDAVSFILTEKQLITVRYIEPLPFTLFSSRLLKIDIKEHFAQNFLVGLLEVVTDRLADILENVGDKFDRITQHILYSDSSNRDVKMVNFQELLQDIGANSELGAKVRGSLLSFNRLVSFFTRTYGSKLEHDCQARLGIISRDINALSDHASFISSKASFLLDATLGMINIQQNNIIKVFSVAAVIFLPPTLIASIYGMNFHYIPELNWYIGYPLAIVLMILSALVPYKYFKMRKWL